MVCQAGSWICNHSPSTQAVSEESHKVPNRNWEAQHDSPPQGADFLPLIRFWGAALSLYPIWPDSQCSELLKVFFSFFPLKFSKQNKAKANKTSWCVISVEISPKAMEKWDHISLKCEKGFLDGFDPGREQVTSNIWIGRRIWVLAACCKYLHMFSRLMETFLSLQIREQIILIH